MAAASDDENTNYWPGFVDALSTMTMMLIFLMLILSLVVISISQSISRQAIMNIAKAAKVDLAGSPASIENLSAQIIQALARLSKPDKPDVPVPEKTPQLTTVIVEPSAKLNAAERPNAAVQPGDQTVVSGSYDALISSGKSSITAFGPDVDESKKPTSNPPQSSQTAPLEPDSGPNAFSVEKKKSPETRIVSIKPPELEKFGGGVDIRESKSTLTIAYLPKAMQLDDVAKEKLANFIATNRDQLSVRPLRLEAQANITNGLVSDARRFAYYRAMSLRQFLIENKVPPKSIVISITDVNRGDNEDTVQLTAN